MADITAEELQRVVSIAIAMEHANNESHAASPAVIKSIAERAQHDASNLDLVREIAQGANINVAYAEIALHIVRPHQLQLIADELTSVTGVALLDHLMTKLTQEIEMHILPVVKHFYPDAEISVQTASRIYSMINITGRSQKTIEAGWLRKHSKTIFGETVKLVYVHIRINTAEPYIEIIIYDNSLLLPCKAILEQFKQKYLPHYQNFIVKLETK